MKTLAVFGVGYVGFPLVLLAARKGYRVIGVDTNDARLDQLRNAGLAQYDDFKERINFTLDGISAANSSDIVVVSVPTPIDHCFRPDFSHITSACKMISRGIKKDTLVILESTISPGTCRYIVRPILEESGLQCEREFFIAHCPERIDPGNKEWPLEDLPRVMGALSEEGLKRAMQFYSGIINNGLEMLSSIEAAEATKLVENAFRDINIAFVNELAQCFDKMGIDVLEVIKAAATKPFGYMPFYPGCGVGGHCIPVDPYYLIEAAKAIGFDSKFMSLAREINQSMPKYTMSKLITALNAAGLCIRGTKIAVLGISYKGNVGDIRESPAKVIVELIKDYGAEIEIYDPFVPELSTVSSLEDAIKAEAIIIATDHDLFKGITGKALAEAGVKVVIDGKNCLDKEDIIDNNIIYNGIGR